MSVRSATADGDSRVTWKPALPLRGLGLSLPVYGVLLLLVAVPLGYLVYGSLHSAAPGAPGAEFTWSNFTDMLSDSAYWEVLGNTLWLAFVVTVFSVAVGVFLAWVLARTDTPFSRTLSILVAVPMFLSPFAGGIAWVILGADKSGLLNHWLDLMFGSFGPRVHIFSFGGLVFVMVLFFAPLVYLFTIGPMANMDGSMEEASRVAGASTARTVWRVTLPVLMPAIISAALMVFVLSAEMFSVPGLIGIPAGFKTLPYVIYQETGTTPPDWGGAAAAGLVLLVIMAAGMFLQARVTKVTARFVTVSGKGARPTTTRLGRWRWAVFAAPAIYVVLGVVLPSIALLLASVMRYYTPDVTWDLITAQHWQDAFTSLQITTALKNTILIGIVAPTIALLIGFWMSYVRHRTKAPMRRSFETLGMLPISVPGIVFGVGLLWAYIRSPIYGTVWLLVLAYCARYLPNALRVISSGLVQIDVGLEEASRVAGAGVSKTLLRVTAPLLRSSVVATWLLLIIYCTRELNVAIMVYTSKSVVLPVLMWNDMGGGAYQEASVVAIVLSVLILLIVAIASLVFRVNLARPSR